MWTSTITQKEIRQGILFITVTYSNGSETFQETYEFPSGEISALDGRMDARLQGLKSLPAFKDQVPEAGVAYEPYSIVPKKEPVKPEPIVP